MNPILQAVEAAMLLGRWTLIAERHAGGCSCCPGLDRGSVTALLSDCIERRIDPAPDKRESLFAELAEALDHLERIQAGVV